MPDAVRPTLAEYPQWAEDSLGHQLGPERRRWFEIVTGSLRQALNDHEFGNAFHEALERYAGEYESETGTPLFGSDGPQAPAWKVKPYDSVLDKLFRKNVLSNDRWPEPPEGGWVGPEQVFSRLDDIIRTRLVCDYLDGPRFLAERLKDFAHECGLEGRYDSREKDRGYYAFHFYSAFAVQLVDLEWKQVEHNATFEVQITTKLQAVLDVLTHRQYEETRLQHPTEGSSWKWEHKTLRFKNAYLAHSLHLLEGVILEVRDHDE